MQTMPATSQLHRAFCAAVRDRRKQLGLTQADVAERMGISQPGYAHIERGLRVPTLDAVERVAAALSVPPMMLLASQEPAEAG